MHAVAFERELHTRLQPGPIEPLDVTPRFTIDYATLHVQVCAALAHGQFRHSGRHERTIAEEDAALIAQRATHLINASREEIDKNPPRPFRV